MTTINIKYGQIKDINGNECIVELEDGGTISKIIALKLRGKVKIGDRVQIIGNYVQDLAPQRIETTTKTEATKTEATAKETAKTETTNTEITNTNEGEMSAARQFCRENNIQTRISFADGEMHKVTLKKDELAMIIDAQGNTKKGVKFFVVENGEEKQFFTSSIKLIVTLSQMHKNDTAEIQMKKENVGGRIRSVFNVKKI